MLVPVYMYMYLHVPGIDTGLSTAGSTLVLFTVYIWGIIFVYITYNDIHCSFHFTHKLNFNDARLVCKTRS